MNQQIILAVIIGLVAGALFVWLLNRSARSHSDAAEEKLQNLQKEFDTYRNEVNAHFAQTADAVDQLTQSYQNVFSHLSEGAQKLMDKNALKAQLEKRHGKAVTLAYLVDESGQQSETQVNADSVVADSKPEAKAAAKTLNYPADSKAPDAVQNAQKSGDDKSRVLSYPAQGQGESAQNVAQADEKAPVKAAEKAVDKAPEKAAEKVADKAPEKAAEKIADKAEEKAAEKPAGEEATETPKKRSVEIAAENAGIPVRHKEGDAGETSLEAVKRHLRDQQSSAGKK